ncbi:MAG: hypothetical protein EOM73_15390 [Bacteroidia bacterium]|nr:hypothetical protein [Bacteroidia bacterium]
MKNLVICHGDGDGIISAAVIAKVIGEAKIVITQPFLLDKIVVDDAEAIYIVDIAVNNKDIAMTTGFASKHADKIVLWADHHQGAEILAEIIGEKLVFDATEPSCPALLVKNGYTVPEEWLNAANASDRPTDFQVTELSERYNKAFKVSLIELQDGNRAAVEKVQRAFIEELVTGAESGIVSEYGSRYEPIMDDTRAAADALAQLIPGVGITTLGEAKVDKTLLCTEGYKKYPVVVVQFASAENGEPVTMVATNRKDLNLVQTFGLPSGAPFRVNLSGDFETTKKLVAEKLA